jgi:hypothetical protein
MKRGPVLAAGLSYRFERAAGGGEGSCQRFCFNQNLLAQPFLSRFQLRAMPDPAPIFNLQ